MCGVWSGVTRCDAVWFGLSPFVVGASVLRAAAHGQATGHTAQLHGQEVVGALAGVAAVAPCTQQA